MYRLCPTHRLTRPVILVGMIVFGVSRPIQLIWIMGSLIAAWENLILWQALFQIILAVVFSSLQLYSLTIPYSLSPVQRGVERWQRK
jgi:hypothetical protein